MIDFEINEKNFKKVLILGIIIVIAYFAITIVSYALPRIYLLDKNTVLDDENTVKCGIDTLYRGSFGLEIQGWAYKEGQPITRSNTNFILKSQETGRMYILQAEMEEMPELQFVDGIDELHSGIHSQSIVLGLRDGDYDLYILYRNDGENLLVKTDVVVEI